MDEDARVSGHAEVIQLDQRRPAPETSWPDEIREILLENRARMASQTKMLERVCDEHERKLEQLEQDSESLHDGLMAGEDDRTALATAIEAQTRFLGQVLLEGIDLRSSVEAKLTESTTAATTAERSAREAQAAVESLTQGARSSSGFWKGFALGVGIAAGVAGIALVISRRKQRAPRTPMMPSLPTIVCFDQRPYYDYRSFSSTYVSMPERIVEHVRVEQVERELQPIILPTETRYRREIVEVPTERVVEKQPIIQPVETRYHTEVLRVPVECVVEKQPIVHNHHHRTQHTRTREVIRRHTKSTIVKHKHTREPVQSNTKRKTRASKIKEPEIRIVPDPALDAALARARQRGR